jgi:hypothetical protein
VTGRPFPPDDPPPPPRPAARRAPDDWDDLAPWQGEDAEPSGMRGAVEDDTLDDEREDDEHADDPALDEDFPLGDGVADRSATVDCPYCGEPGEVAVDPGGGAHQEYVEDCQVCCRPWRVTVAYRADGSADVWAHADDE